MKTTKARAQQLQQEILRAEDAVIAQALQLIEQRWQRATLPAMDSPQLVKDYLKLRLVGLEHEVFAVLFLNSQHQVIDFDIMFRGTLSQTSVYPREVVKAALVKNAGAVVFAHNHPSGVAEPSRADEHLTNTLKSALQLVDVRVLDHMIVGGDRVVSFAERGLL